MEPFSFLAGFATCFVLLAVVGWTIGAIRVSVTREEDGKVRTKVWGGQ